MTRPKTKLLLLGALALVLALSASARAAAPEAQWRLERVKPPQRAGETDQEYQSRPPIGLGKIGDIEFFKPNLGLLITAGNPPTIQPGLWVYDGVSWRQLSTVCGATDGRIAWPTRDDFWTVSDGRLGQVGEHGVSLADNSLCHFRGGEVESSYATQASQANPYQAMHAAGCFSASDCWFAGDALPGSGTGSFQLHWNGAAMNQEANPQGHAVEDMRAFELAPGEGQSQSQPNPPRYLFESVHIGKADRVREEESPFAPSFLHLITPIGVQPPYVLLTPGVPVLAENETASSLAFLHLGSDSSALWGAADPVAGAKLEGAEVTIVRYSKQGAWSQPIGPTTDPSSGNPFTKSLQPKGEKEEIENEEITSIAPDGNGESAWVALTSLANARLASAASAMVARVSSNGAVAERQSLPSESEIAEGVGAKGPADKIACPARNDCWLATKYGWLYHLSDGKALERETDPAFSHVITVRPPDEGVPRLPPDALPVDDSGQHEESPAAGGSFSEALSALTPPSVVVPLVSHMHSRLVHGTTLELRFHLAVRARVRLLARRHRRLVASTAMRTFGAGERKLMLRLNLHDWPTKLELKQQPLETLPTVSVRGSAVTSIGTGFAVLPHTPSWNAAGLVP